jgi:hypothetical protein
MSLERALRLLPGFEVVHCVHCADLLACVKAPASPSGFSKRRLTARLSAFNAADEVRQASHRYAPNSAEKRMLRAGATVHVTRSLVKLQDGVL